MATGLTSSEVTETLTAAAMWGDTELLESFFQNGANPNLLNAQGNTVLHVACYYGERECTSTLLTYESDVNALGADGMTPLHRAVLGVAVLEPGAKYKDKQSIHENQMDLVKLLVGRGAIVKARDNNGNTPRDLAIQYDFYECAELLDDLAKIQEKQEEVRKQQQTVDDLYEACKDGNLEEVKELLSISPELLNECSRNDMTPLMIASREGHLSVIDYLIDLGALPTRTKNKIARTALHFAAERGHDAVVAMLIKRVPRILHYEDSQDGTSLHLAARLGHAKVVQMMLDGASRAEGYRTPCKALSSEMSSLERLEQVPPECFINVLSQSPQDNRTPLHEAVIGGHKHIVEMIVKWLKAHPQRKPFLSSGIFPSPSQSQLQPPPSPHTPATPTSSPFQRTPTQSSTNAIDMMTTRGRTPLQEAVRMNSIDIAQVLLNAGADINTIMRPALDVTANADLTALVQAGLANDLEMVRFLLKRGATDARLKALTRVLRIPYNDIAGILLCYNSTITVDSGSIELRKRAGKDTGGSPLLLIVNWSGKKLPYIHPSWLELTLSEPCHPKADSYAISQLNISDNKLSELPVEIFQLENLQRLDVSRNAITVLPVGSNGWKCNNMSHLDISHNQISSLPVLLFQLPTLKEIICNYNTIQEVPVEMWLSPSLSKLLLQHNQLESFPCPISYRDSGFSTLENQDPSNALQCSLSMPDVSYMQMSMGTHLSPPVNSRSERSTTGRAHRKLSHTSSRSRLLTSPALSMLDRRSSLPVASPLRSRLLELFDSNIEGDVFEEEIELEIVDGKKEDEVCMLESLDLSYNCLTSIPSGLPCLAPKLLKLHLHHNQLKSLGCVTDYPSDLELLDAGHNKLTTAISCAPPRESLRSLLCAQKMLQSPIDNIAPSRCAHRNHRVLRKLGFLKLANNLLVDLQLFRTVEREQSGDLASSMDDSKLDRRSRTFGEAMMIRKDLTKSSAPVYTGAVKESASSNEESTDGGSHDRDGGGVVDVLYCLYPQLSTLDVAYNKLRSVPSHIELISSLSVLTISHNTSIDTIPLELSNLEGLWSLEYEGVPLTNPPAEDLDRFRSASDKLLYMRSLLHDAKPNESMKLMLVGLQKQGKTTLLTRLRDINEVETTLSTFNERIKGENSTVSTSFKAPSFLRRYGPRETPLSTVGVDLGIWKYRKDLEPQYRGKRGAKPLRSVTFYTWDFGGQEEYYATHQCFLSSRALYLVIWSAMDGEEGIDALGPWLHNIQARAPDSPVVIVGTHCDMIKGEAEKERRKKELRDYIEAKYLVGQGVSQIRELGLPQIKEIMFVGCPSIGRGEGLAELRMMLWDISFSLTAPRRKGMGGAKSKLLDQPVPSSYLKLEEEVRRLAVLSQHEEDTHPLMRETEFRDATKHIIANPRELDQAVAFLHDNGILLHYATPALNHLYFIDPQWLCDMLAHVVTVPEVNRFIQRGSGPDAGILKTSVLSHLYKGKIFPQAHRKEYVELLGKFEVALLLDRNRLLVPSMLPSSPRYTIHYFNSVFPRPPLISILAKAIYEHQLEEEYPLSPFSSSTDPLLSRIPQKFPKTPPLFRTGLLLRRFYFMTYVPSGFWPRLISRFLTSSDFAVTVLKAIGFSDDNIQDVIPKLISGDSCTLVNLEWSYWTTGVELWYQGWSVLRVAEIRIEGTFEECDSSPIPHSVPRTKPIEPAIDVDDLSFSVKGQWMSVDQTPNTGLEIVVPDYICASILQQEYPIIDTLLQHSDEQDREEFEEALNSIPRQETSWMSAQLFALTVQQIDTLLEDWYPGIGSKDSGKNMYSIPYVNRVIPCPYCVSGAKVFSESDMKNLSLFDRTELLKPDESHFSSSPVSEEFSTDPFDSFIRVRRDLLPSLMNATDLPDRISISRKRLDDGSPPFDSGVVDPTLSHSPSPHLIQASKFGFMIESCVSACRGLEMLLCPAHPTQPLDILSLVPDLVFGDLPTHFVIDYQLVDQGKFVASGSFGEIYHGAIYPHLSAKDDEGREVAIKVDKQDSRHFSMENATKAYTEIRTEVAILKDLCHENVILFIGIVLNPLCFMLEWAPKGSLQGILEAYNTADARISPWSLVETARQVACGLAYLHHKNIVYYDLKSPNVLTFQFPSPEQSIQVAMGYQKLPPEKFPVHVKIADMGISRKLTPGGVVGYKGTPAFMAPEILHYAGKEACTERVDVFSFGMFLYELLALQFPFERQNLMHNQIEKLVVEGDRPSLQNKELNNPILFLDIMRWAWQQDYHDRPSAAQLQNVLSYSSVPHLVDAYPLVPFVYTKVTSACIVTLPIDISMSVSEGGDGEGETETSFVPSISVHHTYVVQGDLQEEVWLCSESVDPQTDILDTYLSIVSFRGKANFSVENIDVGSSSITYIACINQSVWLGTADGQIMLFDAVSHYQLFSRHLAIRSDQSIVYIKHIPKLRQVIVGRKDGCLLLFDEIIMEQTMPDTSHYDNHINATQLPVRSVFNIKQKLVCSETIIHSHKDQATLWCGSDNEIIFVLNITMSQFQFGEKLHSKPYNLTSPNELIVQLCLMEMEGDINSKKTYLWALSSPGRMLYLWDTVNRSLLSSYCCDDFTVDPVSSLISFDVNLYMSTTTGQIIVLQLDSTYLLSVACNPVSAHTKGIHHLLLLGSRLFPRQWLPKLIGRSNVIEYYKDLLEEEELDAISSRMIGRQYRLLISIGQGFRGVSGTRPVDSSLSEILDNFLLLWLPP